MFSIDEPFYCDLNHIISILFSRACLGTFLEAHVFDRTSLPRFDGDDQTIIDILGRHADKPDWINYSERLDSKVQSTQIARLRLMWQELVSVHPALTFSQSRMCIIMDGGGQELLCFLAEEVDSSRTSRLLYEDGKKAAGASPPYKPDPKQAPQLRMDFAFMGFCLCV